MADTKIGKMGVARRSARTFESDIDIRQAEQNSSDNRMNHNRKPSDLEHSQEREKLVEKATRTRASSTSSTNATAMSDDIKNILGGLDKMAHEKDGEGTLSVITCLSHTNMCLQRQRLVRSRLSSKQSQRLQAVHVTLALWRQAYIAVATQRQRTTTS